MSVVAIVQARMGSRRLPGKVARELADRPLLRLMLDRAAGARSLDRIVVATSDREADDRVVEIAGAAGVDTVRGPEDDVLARYELVLDADPGVEHVVRLTGDCPLIDPTVIDAVVSEHLAADADYTSNTLVRTYPDGLDVEAVRGSALRDAAREGEGPATREHVTPFVYRRPERFAVRHHRGPRLLGDERWTVDTADDLVWLRRIVAAVDDPVAATWQELLTHVGERATPWTPVHLRPAVEADRERLLAWRNDPEAVATSGSGRPVERAEHDRWFAALLTGGASRLWIAERAGLPVGQVRVDVRTGIGTVSIAVDRDHRGQGLGGAMLAALERRLQADAQVVELHAFVRPDNAPSRALFAGAGYDLDAEVDGLLRYRLVR